MVIGVKDSFKLFGIMIIAACAAFVCTLFLNYRIDLIASKDDMLSVPGGEAMYHALLPMSTVISLVSGGCLIVTSVVMLLFYVKNYVDSHGKELGIMKALGYSDIKIARHFCIFGSSVFLGAVIGVLIVGSFCGIRGNDRYLVIRKGAYHDKHRLQLTGQGNNKRLFGVVDA